MLASWAPFLLFVCFWPRPCSPLPVKGAARPHQPSPSSSSQPPTPPSHSVTRATIHASSIASGSLPPPWPKFGTRGYKERMAGFHKEVEQLGLHKGTKHIDLKTKVTPLLAKYGDKNKGLLRHVHSKLIAAGAHERVFQEFISERHDFTDRLRKKERKQIPPQTRSSMVAGGETGTKNRIRYEDSARKLRAQFFEERKAERKEAFETAFNQSGMHFQMSAEDFANDERLKAAKEKSNLHPLNFTNSLNAHMKDKADPAWQNKVRFIRKLAWRAASDRRSGAKQTNEKTGSTEGSRTRESTAAAAASPAVGSPARDVGHGVDTSTNQAPKRLPKRKGKSSTVQGQRKKSMMVEGRSANAGPPSPSPSEEWKGWLASSPDSSQSQGSPKRKEPSPTSTAQDQRMKGKMEEGPSATEGSVSSSSSDQWKDWLALSPQSSGSHHPSPTRSAEG